MIESFDRSDIINIHQINKKSNWASQENFWKDLEKIASNLVNVDFYGGEPFYIKAHSKFLKYLIDNNLSNDIRIHYNTNGSIFPEYLLDLWKTFQEVDVQFSIDDIEERFELQRDGGNWLETLDVLDKFQKIDSVNIKYGVFSTVSLLNVYYLPELINWYETRQFNSLHFNVLVEPKFLSIDYISFEFAQKTIKKLQSLPNEVYNKHNIDSIVGRLQTAKFSNQMTEKFTTYMRELDFKRKQDFAKAHPEVAKLMNY
jgi:organic radical activating enzyme